LPSKTSSAARPAPALAAAGVRPRKSRGQNFLVQPAVANRIVAAAELSRGDQVIEIGPGLGILSERIVAYPIARLALIELDRRLAARLAATMSGDRRVRVIDEDFLKVDLPSLVGGGRLKVLGNLPFNAAAAILRRLCDNAALIARMVLMFQREVAERIRAAPGARAYGALSVFTALYFEIESHFRVAAGSFHPRPRVDAEVLVFVPRAARLFEPGEERRVLAAVRAAFSAPRKTLRNSLAHALKLAPAAVDAALASAAIDPGARAEMLAPADFVRLARALPGSLHAPRDA
jgi:16S rRNA (adenine1518-N6/adenine1519-N6)-dimethyltransferase